MSIRPGSTVTKDPDAEKVYTFDWSDWLVGDAVLASADFEIDVAPDGSLTLSDETRINDNTAARVKISGGTLGKRYLLRCRATTNEVPSQTDDRSIWVSIVAQ